MIDRLEELLGMVGNEDQDEDERDESVVEAAPVIGPGRRRTAPAREETEPPGKPEETDFPEKPEAAEPPKEPDAPGEPEKEGPVPETPLEDGTAPEEGGPEVPVIPDEGWSEPVPEELERAVREAETLREERSGVQPPAGNGETEALSPAPPGEDGFVLPTEGQAGEDGQGLLSRRGGDLSGLELLYQAAARAEEPAAELLSAGQGVRQILPDPVPSEPVRMTVEEMDRAMRRDSRRYDGGMTIY